MFILVIQKSSSSYERIKNKYVTVLLSNQKARKRYTLILQELFSIKQRSSTHSTKLKGWKTLLFTFYIKFYEISQLHEIYNIVGDPGIQGEHRYASLWFTFFTQIYCVTFTLNNKQSNSNNINI